MPINKAVISAAGFGTRFLPISKTIQKEMVPILNRPAIDYVVNDCIRAGVRQIVIVMNAHNYQPLHYFRENKRLFKYLNEAGKPELYDQIKDLHSKAEFYFVKQLDSDGYGTSTPIKLAADHIKDEEAFLYLTGDDFIYFSDPERCLVKELIDLYQKSSANGVLTCLEKPWKEIHRYGVVEVENKNGFSFLKNLVEKPKPGTAKSNLVNVSKYILTPAVLPLINQQNADQASGEYFITDIVLELAKNGKIVVNKTDGEFLNAGSPLDWIKANLRIAADDENLKQEISEYIKEIF